MSGHGQRCQPMTARLAVPGLSGMALANGVGIQSRLLSACLCKADAPVQVPRRWARSSGCGWRARQVASPAPSLRRHSRARSRPSSAVPKLRAHCSAWSDTLHCSAAQLCSASCSPTDAETLRGVHASACCARNHAPRPVLRTLPRQSYQTCAVCCCREFVQLVTTLQDFSLTSTPAEILHFALEEANYKRILKAGPLHCSLSAHPQSICGAGHLWLASRCAVQEGVEAGVVLRRPAGKCTSSNIRASAEPRRGCQQEQVMADIPAPDLMS